MSKLTLPTQVLRPTRGVLQQFAVGLVGALLVLAFLLRPAEAQAGGLLLLAVVVALLGALRPSVLRVPFVALSVVTFPLGVVLQRVLLSLFFFLVFTPFALLLRARRSRQEEQVPGWRASPPARPTEDYFRPY